MTVGHYLFLSPHLDDVTLSCGGLVWDLGQQGHRVEVWTLMAGLPTDENYSPFAQEMHANWGISGVEAVRARRAEDREACAVLGAELRHFDWPDAIYRYDAQTGAPIVNSDDELFSRLPEQTLVDAIAAMIMIAVPSGATLVLPIGLGNHVDHQAVVGAGRQVPRTDFWYADYPYINNHFESPFIRDGRLESVPYNLSEAALQAWQSAVLCYTSQLSTFWRDMDETRLALRNYMAGGGGRLWRKTSLDSPQA